MPKHLDTPQKGEVRGAKKMLEFLERSSQFDTDKKLQNVADALDFILGPGQSFKGSLEQTTTEI